jgi:hypothetical protein
VDRSQPAGYVELFTSPDAARARDRWLGEHGGCGSLGEQAER